MKKYNLAFALNRGDLIVLRAGQSLGEFRQFMIMRRKQSFRGVLRRIVEIFCDCPGDRQSVKRRRAASDLIEQHQRTRRSVVQDRRRLGHFHHES